MRDQYAGDVSDVLKFALLRALTGSDKTLGIAWYYVPGHDGRADGRHREWQHEPAWRALDDQVCTGLAALPERSVAALERAPIWPKGVLFYREPVPLIERDAWGTRMRTNLDGADIVFLDLDDGLGKAGKEKQKHASPAEIGLFRKPGRAIVFITFPGRNKPHDDLLKDLHALLKEEAGARSVITITTNVSVPSKDGSRCVPRLRWFTILDPDAALLDRVCRFLANLDRACIPHVSARLDGAPCASKQLSAT